MNREELLRLLAEEQEREGPPVEFDPRALRAVLCGLACFWVAVFALVACWLDWSVWGWICRRF